MVQHGGAEDEQILWNGKARAQEWLGVGGIGAFIGKEEE
jgi:hypothetical protein